VPKYHLVNTNERYVTVSHRGKDVILRPGIANAFDLGEMTPEQILPYRSLEQIGVLVRVIPARREAPAPVPPSPTPVPPSCVGEPIGNDAEPVELNCGLPSAPNVVGHPPLPFDEPVSSDQPSEHPPETIEVPVSPLQPQVSAPVEFPKPSTRRGRGASKG